MEKSTHVEEFLINFAAFVNSARNVTFVLQNEFSKDERFIVWYGQNDKDAQDVEGTKKYEMRNSSLAKFFLDLRNDVVKTGSNGLGFCMTIDRFRSDTDALDRPDGSSIVMSSKGIYYLVSQGTHEEDWIPAQTKGQITHTVIVPSPPTSDFLGQIPENERDILSLSKRHYNYLKVLVNEWTGILNTERVPE